MEDLHFFLFEFLVPFFILLLIFRSKSNNGHNSPTRAPFELPIGPKGSQWLRDAQEGQKRTLQQRRLEPPTSALGVPRATIAPLPRPDEQPFVGNLAF